MTKINLEEATGPLHDVLEKVLHGEEVILTKGEQAVARLVSIPTQSTESNPKRQFGSARGLIHMTPDFDEPLHEFDEYAQ
jgi:antitoxin (DNA-binding transcriptional repressor) of toxin-antitoxin stability system